MNYRMADKGIQVSIGLKDHYYLVRQHKLPQLKQKKTGLNVDMDEAVMRARGSTGSGDNMI